MTYPLAETFDDALGRWNGYAPFDATEAYDGLKGFLSTQEHVDLRSFRNIADLLAAPQHPDLDTVPQTTLVAETQTAMQTNPGLPVANENWSAWSNFTTSALTASGNEITDGERTEGFGVPVVGHSYDGRSGDSSFGIWEATTNLFTNGGFETNTTGWSAYGTAAISRDTTQKMFGAASLKVVTSGVSNQEGAQITGRMGVTPGATYAYSAWVNAPAGTTMKMYVDHYANNPGTNLGSKGASTTTFVATGGWQRVSVTFVALGPAVQFYLFVYGSPAAATTFWVDAAQLEQRRAASNLTTTGNEITDSERGDASNVVGHSYDGRTNDSSFGIWEATTNLVPNGGAETNTSYTQNAGGVSSVTRDTTYAKFGTASFKITCAAESVDGYTFWHNDTSGTEGGTHGIPVTPGSIIVFSAWVKIPVALTGSNPTVKLRVIEWDAGGVLVKDNYSPPVNNMIATYGTTFDWTRVYYAVQVNSNTTNVSLRVNLNTGVGNIWVDGVQLEQRRGATTITTSGTEISDYTRRLFTNSPTSALTVAGNEITDTTRAATLTTTSSGQMMDAYGWSIANWVVNPSFKTATAPWTLFGGAGTTGFAASWNSTGGVGGTGCAQMTATGGATSSYMSASCVPGNTVLQLQQYAMPCVAGQVIRARGSGQVAALSSGSIDIRLAIEFRDNTGTLLSSNQVADQASAVVGTWYSLTGTFTAPANAAFAVMRVDFGLVQAIPNGATATVLVDNAQLCDNTLDPGSYVDGDSGGAYSWMGTSGLTPTKAVTGDSSYGIFRAATNLFRRGQCDATTDWALSTGATNSTDATMPAPFSPQSIKVVCDGTQSRQGVTAYSNTGQAAAAGTSGVGSVWFKGVPGMTYFAEVYWVNTDASTTNGNLLNFTATGAWQLLKPPGVAVGTGKTGDKIGIEVRTATQRAETHWIAHPMLEIGQTLVAPYVATSGGVTATHGAARVQTPSTFVTPSNGWFAARVRMGYDAASVPNGWTNILRWGSGANDYIEMIYDGSEWSLGRATTGSGSSYANAPYTSVAGTVVTVIGMWNATTVQVSVNGGAFVSAACTFIPTISDANFDIGAESDGTHILHGQVLWAATGLGALTAADAAALNAFGNTDPTVSLPSSLSSGASVTGVWGATNSTLSSPTFSTPTGGGDGRAPESTEAIYEAATNLITNGGFETNTAGWNLNAASLSRSTLQAKFGAASMFVMPTGSSGGCYVNGGTTINGTTGGSKYTAVTGGNSYAFSAWLYNAGGGSLTVSATIEWYDANTTGLARFANAQSITLAAGSGWQRVVVSAAAPAWAVGAVATLYGNNNTGLYPFFVDGAQLEVRRATGGVTLSGNEITDATRLAALSWATTASGGMTDDKGWSVANWVTNPNFKNNINNWQTFGGSGMNGTTTATWNSTGGKGSTGCLQMVGTPNSATNPYMSCVGVSAFTLAGAQATAMPCTSGQTIRLRGSVQLAALASGTPPDLRLTAYFYDNTGANISTVPVASQAVPVVGTWYDLTGTTVAPASAAYVMVRMDAGVVTPIPNGVACTVLFDNAQICDNAVDPGAYVDGDSGELGSGTSTGIYSWWGTAEASFTRRYFWDSSYGIRRGATNLFGNGQCDAATPYNTFNGTGMTRAVDAATPAPFSPQSIKVTTDGTTANQGTAMNSVAGLAAAVGTNACGSVWFKGVSGQSYTHQIRWANTDSTLTYGTATNFTATGAWQLLVPGASTVATGKTGDHIDVIVSVNGTRAETFWVAHPMIESNQTLVAPYVATTGAATATHSPARVQTSAAMVSSTGGWVALRARMSQSSVNDTGDPFLWSWGDDANHRFYVYVNHADGLIHWGYTSDGVVYNEIAKTASTYNAGDTITVVVYWISASKTLGISFNGSVFQTATYTAAFPTPTSQPSIGIQYDGTSHFLNGDVLWAMCGTGTTLTNADAATLNALGNTDPNIDTTLTISTAVQQMLWTADAQSILTPGATTQPATPYVETNGATATRAAATVTPPSSLINASQSWVAVRFSPGWAKGQEPNTWPTIFRWQLDGSNRLIGYFNHIDGQCYFARQATGSTSVAWALPSFNADDDLLAVFAWDNSNIYLSINGGAFTSAFNNTIPTGLPSTFSLLMGDNPFDGRVRWAMTGTGTLAAADLTTLNALGGTDPNVDTTLPITAGVTSHWSADSNTYNTPRATTMVATPYVHTDGATAARAAAGVTAPTSLFGGSATQFWAACRVRLNAPYNGDPTFRDYLRWTGAGGSDTLCLQYRADSQTFEVSRRTPSQGTQQNDIDSSVQSFAAGTMVTLVAVWTATQVGLSINGAPFIYMSNTNVNPQSMPSTFWIGWNSNNSRWSNDDIKWMLFGSGTLTNTDAATLYSLGDTDPNVDTTLGSTAAVTALWTADSIAYVTPGATEQVATPYVHTDGATQTRNAANVQAPPALLTTNQGWVAIRRRHEFPSTLTSNAFVPFALSDGTLNNRIAYVLQNGVYSPRANSGGVGYASGGGVASTFNTGDYVTEVYRWTPTQIGVSINGAPFVMGAKNAFANFTPTTFNIGNQLGSNQVDGEVLWVACGLGPLTDADAATINAFGNTDPTYDQLPTTGQPTMVWSADTTTFHQSSGLHSLTVGPIAAHGGWSGLQMTADGEVIDCVITSSTTDVIDISAMDELVITLPDYNTFDTTSTVQLTSSPDGSFGTSAYNSAAIPFSANESIMPEFRRAVSAFATGAGASFSLSKITGVQFTITDNTPPANGTVFTMLGMRAVKNAWQVSALDFDTRIGAICVPVTLDAADYGGTVAQNFQFVRGDGTKEDPIPMNLAMNMYFYPGGSTSPNKATGGSYNVIGFILREQKDSTAGTGSHIQARLKFNDATTVFETVRVDTTGGSPGVETDTALNSVTVGGPLDSTKRYILRVQIIGTQIDAQIYETDTQHNVGALVWQLPTTISDQNYAQHNGRVGFVASLLSRDAYIDQIDVAPMGYAQLVTKTYASRSPVDGAQLAAVFAPDLNLWSSFTGADLAIDQTKTVSGNGSYRTALGLTTNSFVVDDWTETYLKLAIWVPSGVTLSNQPRILLNTNTSFETLPMPRLQPSQWNDLYFDLGIFRNLITATGYSLSILPAASPDTPLGFFWVDDMMIGRRRVAWSVRATANGLFRDFKNNVNNPSGAVHFPANERGTALQVKAIALTEDAWVSSFNLFPRYAELGLPVYDQAYAKR